MKESNFLQIFNQVSIPDSGIILDLPNYGGIFQQGIFSAIGFLLFLALAILVVVWVGFSLYGAFRIISSFGDPQKIEQGWKTIKSVWIGISYFLFFFAIVGFVAVFIGIGAPWDWATNLQQCSNDGPAPGRFYFQGKVDASSSVRKSYSDQVKEYRSTNPSITKVYVLCCDDGNQQYIGLSGVNAATTDCRVNSTENI